MAARAEARAEEIWTAVPQARRFKPPRSVRVVPWIASAALLFSLIAVASANKSKTAPQASTPPNVGFAQLVAQSYVNGQALNVPMASGLTSSLGRESLQAAGGVSASVVNPPSQDMSVAPLGVTNLAFERGTVSTAKPSTETDYFLLQYKSGSFGQIVVVVDDLTTGPELAAVPTVLPAPAATGPAETGTVTAQQQQPVTSNVAFRINQWATAFASNSQTTLYEITGDTKNRTYSGLGGFALVGQPTIVSSTPDTRPAPKKLLATVELTMKSTNDPSIVVQAEYDLLLTNLSDNYPDVAAWGPPGSGSALTPYENAQ